MSNNPFDTVPAADGGAVAGGGNKKVLVAGGLAAAVALAGAGYFLLMPAADETDTSLGGPTAPVTKRVTTLVKPAVKTVKPAVKPATQVPPTSTARLGRDPFRALYVAQPVAAAPAPGTTGTPTTTTTTSGSTTTGSTTTGSSSSSSGSTAPKTYAMTLKKVYGSGSQRTAEFVIGGKTMLAKVGSVFGPTSELKLLSVGQNSKGLWVATIQVGDSEPFDAIQNQTVYVQ